ncbi:MAG TPA: choice-of-anchor tandem repeat GloVer-containing protein [Candidatus Solibacter sp.]|nr:choice-of-anchor tandem repeat GloVer-containing protein [Candidatus Solibacter sp.]
MKGNSYRELWSRISVAFLWLVLGAVFFAVNPGAEAQTFKTILSFNGTTDGAYPSAGFVKDASGNLYSTTQAGGVFNFGNGGTVYKLDRQRRETVLYSFCALTNCADGGVPFGGVTLDSAGNLYGAASGGGKYGFGAVFKLDPSGKETVLYSFQGMARNSDGSSPGYGNLVRDAAGNLYGTTLNGGLPCSQSAAGCGVIYKINPAGSESIIHRFTGGADGGVPPTNLIADAGGRLYGTTSWGGANNCGEIFKVSAQEQSTGIRHLTVLYSFNCETDAWFPNAGLIRDAHGVLYGTGAFGGTWSRGGVFKFDPSTGVETLLYSFQGGTSDGCAPSLSSLILDAQGNLYGTTPNCGATGYGDIFKLDPSGNETVLYNFENGGIPQGTMLREAAGDFIGTTYFDANFACCGTVFKFTP